MSICPCCKEEIDYLNAVERVTKRYDNTLQVEDGNPKWDEWEESEGEISEREFECPDCMESIFDDEKKAIRFLKCNDDLAEMVAETLENKDGDVS